MIENKPGGDGIVAIDAFVSAQDDHVLLLRRPRRSSRTPTCTTICRTILMTSPRSRGCPIRWSEFRCRFRFRPSLKDLVAEARARPGQMNWAGMTGALDIMFEGWLKSIGVDVKKVPYRNPVEAANDLAAGRVQIYKSAYAIARPQIEKGKIRILAVTNTTRAGQSPTFRRSRRPAFRL